MFCFCWDGYLGCYYVDCVWFCGWLFLFLGVLLIFWWLFVLFALFGSFVFVYCALCWRLGFVYVVGLMYGLVLIAYLFIWLIVTVCVCFGLCLVWFWRFVWLQFGFVYFVAGLILLACLWVWCWFLLNVWFCFDCVVNVGWTLVDFWLAVCMYALSVDVV